MASNPRLRPLARAVLRTQTDDRLVALARRGKEGAFAEIVDRYRAGLVAFAAAYGPPDPEDVVQESLIRAWDALRDSTGEMHLKAWLYTIVRNRALNARRDARVYEPLADDLDGVRQPAEIVLTSEELDRVVGAIASLPEPQREALVRSALEGHTHAQIATALGSSPGAVRQLIYRARVNVRHAAGAVIPLPLVALLAEAGAGSAAAGATAAASGAGAAGGASLATKAAVVAAIGAAAVGTGIVIDRSRGGDRSEPPSKSRAADERPGKAAGGAGAGPGGAEEAAAAPPSRQASERDDDRAEDRDDDRVGSDDSGSGSDDSGPSSSSGTGSSGSADDDSDSSGSSGSSGSGSSSSSSSGSGSSGDGGDDSSGSGGDDDEIEVEELDAIETVEADDFDDDNSGSGGDDD
jgi:RNA polymerase sigma factor (sigma-70 family)